MLADSLSPVITKLSLDFDESVVESIVPNPKSMPFILKNEIVNFYVTYKAKLEKPTKFIFTYEDTVSKLPYKSEI